jgi:hypothetical protein
MGPFVGEHRRDARPVGSNASIALGWCAGIVAVSPAGAGVLFARRTS